MMPKLAIFCSLPEVSFGLPNKNPYFLLQSDFPEKKYASVCSNYFITDDVMTNKEKKG